MRSTVLSLICAACACLSSVASPAAQTRLDEIVRLSVLQGGLSSAGTYLVAFEVDLAEGWKTYWRRPGEAGIPPVVSFRGSRNVADTVFTWPAPIVFEQSGMRSIGYKDRLVLPLEVTPSDKAHGIHLKGRMEIGVCRDICIPATLRFEAALDPHASRNPAIAAALARRPYSAREAGVQASRCDLAPTQDGVRLTARITLPSTGAPEVAVIEPANPDIWASEADVTRKGNVLTATSDLVHVEGRAFALDRSRLRLTVLGHARAVDIRGCSAD